MVNWERYHHTRGSSVKGKMYALALAASMFPLACYSVNLLETRDDLRRCEASLLEQTIELGMAEVLESKGVYTGKTCSELLMGY